MSSGIVKFKRVWEKVVNFLLMFFVSYGVLQSSSISLKLKNDVIIATVFLALCLQLLLCMIINKISILPKKRTKSIWQYIKPIDYMIAIFLLVNSIWIFVIPQMNGFSVSDAISEVGMLATFILYFPLAALIRLKEIDFKFIVKIFYWGTFALAILHCALWSAEVFTGSACKDYFEFLSKISFLNVGNYIEGWGIVRITFSNSILLSAGLLLNFKVKKPLSPWVFIRILIFVFAIMSTYLKSLWFGAFLGVALVGVYLLYLLISRDRSKNKKLIKSISVTLAFMIISTVALNYTAFEGSAINRLKNSFINTGGITDIPEDDISEDASNKFDKTQDKIGAIHSNNIKIEQTQKLVEQWKKNPVLGYGYGSSVPGYYRSDTNLYSYEMTAFSLLMKVGIVGITTWVALALWAFALVIINNKKKLMHIVLWTSIAGAFLVSIQTNPLLFSANSINLIMFLVLFGVYSGVNKNVKDEDE